MRAYVVTATLAALLLLPAAASAAATTRVSVAADGAQGDGDHFQSRISADGRVAVFASTSTNLAPQPDTNGFSDVFAHDLSTRATERISVSSAGAQGNSASSGPAADATGTIVAFNSVATNLDPADTDPGADIYVRDRAAGTTTLISEPTTESAPRVTNTFDPSITDDGRYVVYDVQVFHRPFVVRSRVAIHDRATGTTQTFTLGDGSEADESGAGGSVVSADGSTIAFLGTTPDGTSEVYVRHAGGEIEKVFGTGAQSLSISADGQRIGFVSGRSDLAPGDTNNRNDLFVLDLQAGTRERASLRDDDTQFNGHAQGGVSHSGAKAVFWDSGFTNSVFLRDLDSDSTEQINVLPSGQPSGGHPNSVSAFGALSADDRRVVFESFDPELVAGDDNDSRDVFVRDRGGPPPRVSIDDVRVTEGNAGTTSARFTVSLEAPSESALTLRVRTADGSATAGSDYTAVDASVTIAAGASSAEVVVPVTGDGAVEADETFTVTLSEPSAADAVLVKQAGTGTIANDDVQQRRCGALERLLDRLTSILTGRPPRCPR